MAAKLFFVLLVVVAVAFFWTMWMGAGRNDSQKLPASDNKQKEDNERTTYAQNNPPPAWIGNLIGPFSPKLSMPQREFHITAAGLVVEVPGVPAGKPQFRNASLQVTSLCLPPVKEPEGDHYCPNVAISYESKDEEGKNLKLNSQGWKPTHDHPNQASLVILSKGGTIRMRCSPPIGSLSCTATAELR